MPDQNQLQLIKPGGAVEFFPLDPHQSSMRIGRDPHNDIVIEHPAVASFHAVLFCQSRPVKLILLAQQFEREQPPLQAGPGFSVFELAGHRLVFFEGASPAALPPPPPAATTPAAPTIETLVERQDGIIEAALLVHHDTINPGQTAAAQLSLTNRGHSTARFDITLLGLDESWSAAFPPQIELAPDQQQTVALAIRPLQPGLLPAGSYPAAVRVTSPDYPRRYSQHRFNLIVAPTPNFSIEELSPRRQIIFWSTAAAEFTIAVINSGNCAAQFNLSGRADDRACNFEFSPPGELVDLAGQVSLHLQPGERVQVPVRVTPTVKQLVGLSKQVHRFTLTVSMPQSEHLPRSVSGRVIRRPLVGPGMLLTLAALLLAAGLFFLEPILNYVAPNRAPRIVSQTNAADEVTVFPFSVPVRTAANPAEADVDAAGENRMLTYEQMFQEIAPQHGLDWHTLEALAYRESRMNYLAVGAAGDMGLMQVIPSTWGEWAPKVGVSDPFDPYSNIQVGAVYLAYVRDFCRQRGYTEPHWMLVAYNWGPNRLEAFWTSGGDWPQIPATQRNYATRIIDMATSRAATTASFEEFYPNLAVRP